MSVIACSDVRHGDLLWADTCCNLCVCVGVCLQFDDVYMLPDQIQVCESAKK